MLSGLFPKELIFNKKQLRDFRSCFFLQDLYRTDATAALKICKELNEHLLLMKKPGFRTVSVNPKGYKLREGTYQDIVYMQKFIERKGMEG